ncbi:MAG: PHP domain-containing protein [Acidimicrobiales bacterium]
MLDYHLHLWAHGQHGVKPTVEAVAAYCDRATAAGVVEIAITEHLFRFREARDALAGFWDDDPDPSLAANLARYWDDECESDLDVYVEVLGAARAAGLPVAIGIEVDHYANRMDRVAGLLNGRPFDVVLGSVHWIGSWGFDNLGDPLVMAEWDRRSLESVWDGYTGALEELAGSGVCDVLAHPDLPKVGGRRPSVPEEWYDRMAEAASAAGMAAEVSSAGLRKPAGEPYPAAALLERFRRSAVPVTTASDAHRLADVASGMGELRSLLAEAGYDRLVAFRGRLAREVALAPGTSGDVAPAQPAPEA